jgi:hypothetical protein
VDPLGNSRKSYLKTGQLFMTLWTLNKVVIVLV